MSTLTQFFGGGSSGSGIPVELLVVGGGAGGGGSASQAPGGGGGAGQVLKFSQLFDYSTALTITIGGGGAAGASSTAKGSDGSQSIITYNSSIITAEGGGGGGAGTTNVYGSSTDGGSGGGNGGNISSGTVRPVSAAVGVLSGAQLNQPYFAGGCSGGLAYAPGNNSNAAGGGGGATSPGLDGAGYFSEGGRGYPSTITGTLSIYASGGKGGIINIAATSGSANSGIGGSGGWVAGAGAGGSGVVVIAYQDTFGVATATGTYDEPTRSGYRVYRFTGSGTITFPAS